MGGHSVRRRTVNAASGRGIPVSLFRVGGIEDSLRKQARLRARPSRGRGRLWLAVPGLRNLISSPSVSAARGPSPHLAAPSRKNPARPARPPPPPPPPP